MLDQTPVPEATEQQQPPATVTPARLVDTTTLLQNEDESFALAPVEASALKGQRRQRKRKLIVDEIKAITGEGMKAQLSDSSDIVTTLDIAPPTKRLMHWKETGGVDELFNLPGRKLFAKHVLVDYQNNLKITSTADEHFDTLPGGNYKDDLQLEHVGTGTGEDEEASPTKRGRKRKQPESPEKSAYLKRQEALAKEQENFLAEEKRRREQEKLRESQEVNSSWAGQQMASPAYSGGQPASMGYPTPVHEASYGHQAPFEAGGQTSELPPPGQQGSFTEQWVSQVQSTPASLMASPPLTSPQPQAASFDHQPPSADDWDDGHDNYETDNYGNDDYNDDDEEEEDNDAHIEGDEELGEDETIEEFESRVLNKRAALLHRQLARNFTDTFSEHLAMKRCSRKQVAQKFHSILVLQKMMTLNLSQDEHIPYSEISLAKGPAWDGGNH